MRIVIDMQGAQSESRFRGIGRYSLEFAKSVARSRGAHEVILALNGALPDSIAGIREEFSDLLPRDCIRVWSSPSDAAYGDLSQSANRQIAEALREEFLFSLDPDVIHITSLFEGYLDDAVTGIGRDNSEVPVSCHCYDLIPMLNPEIFLDPAPNFRDFYENKLTTLQRASLILTISDSAKGEIEAFNASASTKIPVENVSAGVGVQFFDHTPVDHTENHGNRRLNIDSPFLLYVGGADPTKNLDRLVSAFAALPAEHLENHQLVLAGKMPASSHDHLKRLGKKLNLKEDRLKLLGHVDDDELLDLYRSCRLFVCPSTHEGFGLPPLEAMACGAPVIASNASSLPEVIGNAEALFDPLSADDICAKIVQVLEDPAFSSSLAEKGLRQARQFSWHRVGQSSWLAWEALHDGSRNRARHSTASSSAIRPTVETVTPLLDGQPVTESCLAAIAKHIALNESQGTRRQLFLDVSELSRQDAGTGVQRVVRGYLQNLLLDPLNDFEVRPVYASLSEPYRYADKFTADFLGQEASTVNEDKEVRWQRGDIFLALDCQHHVQLHHKEFFRRLQSDGVIVKFVVYDLLPIQYPDLFFDAALATLHAEWLGMVAKSDGAICISQATADALEDWLIAHSIETSPYFQIDSNHIGSDLDGSQPSAGRPDNADALIERIAERHSFLCVSTIEPRKQQDLILNAVEELWAKGLDLNLVFVGRAGWQTEELSEYLRSHPEINHRLFWLEGISDEFLTEVYQACSCVVAASLNEGFGLSLVEAARFGKPIIARDIPVFREIADGHAQFYDSATPQDLAKVLTRWLDQFRAGDHIRSEGLAVLTWQESTENLKKQLAVSTSPRKQLMVDVSELVQRDAATGIQRVVKKICAEWLARPPSGYRVELVYAAPEHGYRYARAFSSSFCPHNFGAASDDYVEFAPGDIFFGLDLQPQVQVQHQSQLQEMQRLGVIVKFMVYDLLPVTMPQFFPSGAEKGMHEWLRVTAQANGVVCISESTAADYATWIGDHMPTQQKLCGIEYAHLGSDFAGEMSVGNDRQQRQSCAGSSNIAARFLMVGTVEPRKGHAGVLDAFELAWKRGDDIHLLLVGKKGWMCDHLEKRILNHPELNKRLLWLSDADDTALERAYSDSDCLIVASYGEGFGLPIVEAAAQGLAILARDLPVFREIAAGHAQYFGGDGATGLLSALSNWITLFRANQHPKSEHIELITWESSADNIAEKLTKQSLL